MIYLLAKYTLLFLLTAALGFVLGYWWSRRKFVDVSESYEDLRKATDRTDAKNWSQLWNRLDGIPEPKEADLSRVYERLDGVASALSSIPQPEPVSLAAVESGLETLTDKVRNIPVPEKQKEPDFRPLHERIEKLEKGINAIPAPADLAPVSMRLGKLEEAVSRIPKPAPQKDVDLQPVKNELTSIRNDIKGMPKVETHQPVDLAPVTRQLGSLEKRVTEIPRPESVNLKPIDGRLKAIETEIGRLGKKLSRPAKTERPSLQKTATPRKKAQPKQTRSEPRVLNAALFGNKDNLKLISGVGPKLEKLLNKNGVYYFWQVASWSRSDISVIDDRLDTFRGRISRDNWVTQAKQLRRTPGAARMPAE